MISRIIKWLRMKYFISLFRKEMKHRGIVDLHGMEYTSKGGFAGDNPPERAKFSYDKNGTKKIKYE